MKTKGKNLIIVVLILLGFGLSFSYFLLQKQVKPEEEPLTPEAICEKIEDEEQKNLCLAVVKGESAQCENLADQSDVCYMFIAFKTKNASLCEKVMDKHGCLAIVKGDHAECDKAEYEKTECKGCKDSCHFMVGAMEGDALACDYLSDEIADFCRAVLAKDTSFCEDLEEKEKCYGIVAVLSGNESLCDKAEKDRQEVCIALATRKGLDCTVYGAECTFLAVLTENPSVCDQIPIRPTRDSCYFSVALRMVKAIPIERVGGYY